MENLKTRSRRKEIMTVGGGCFWCIEAIFNQINGIEKVVSGFMGGTVPGSPTYREVRSGLTGHAEVVQVTYNPEVIDYENLLHIFMSSHDPTTLNRQGADIGTQYRSVIFYYNESQRRTIDKVFFELSSFFKDPIITEVKAVERFHPADDDHQNYFGRNPNEMYCEVVIMPKLKKLRDQYSNKLK